MGITVSCKKTNNSFDMGYIGFNALRCKVAELAGSEFGQHYKKLSDSTVMLLSGNARKAYFAEYNAKTRQMIENKKVHYKLADFCMQSDCEGQIHYGACKVIYEIVKGYDGKEKYGYSGRSDCATFGDFKQVLLDCINTKSDMVWK